MAGNSEQLRQTRNEQIALSTLMPTDHYTGGFLLEIKLGNYLQKRVIKVGDDNSLTIEKPNGTVVKKWAIEEIYGILCAPANLVRDGSLAIAETYDQAQVTTFTTITMMEPSVIVTRGDKEKVQELIAWYEANKKPSSMKSPYLLEASSLGSFLGLDGNTIVIRHTGFINAMSKGGLQGEKRIPIKSVLSVQFKPATDIAGGYIQFETAGGSQRPARGGVFEAAGDENSVLFSKTEMPQFEKFRDKVNSLIEGSGSTTPAASSADELAKFAKLRDDGIITEEELQQKKKRLRCLG